MPGKHESPRRRSGRTETSDFTAGLIRMMYAYGRRAGSDPAALAHLPAIHDALRDATNLAVFEANTAGQSPYSLAEIAAVVGVTREAIFKRKKSGRQVAERLAGDKLVRIADVRRARAETLAAAGVEDRTGSPHELAAITTLRQAASG
jgi:hypothetical protein